MSFLDARSREAAQECSPRRKPWERTPVSEEPCKGGRNSIPEIFFVAGNVVSLEKKQELLLKRAPPVVFFLPRDVSRDFGDP